MTAFFTRYCKKHSSLVALVAFALSFLVFANTHAEGIEVRNAALVAAYALLLGYLEGMRGNQLLRSQWVQVLDATPEQLVHLAKDAKRLGMLDLKQAGDVVEIGFSSLLTRDEIRDSYVKN